MAEPWAQVPAPTPKPRRVLKGERPGATPGQVRRARAGRAVWRFLAWFGRTVAGVVSVLLFGLISLVAVLLPWAVQRLLWLDPLGVTRPRGSRWIPRRPEGANPSHPWVRDPALRRPHPFLRTRTVLFALVATFLFVVGTVRATTSIDMDYLDGSPAYADAAWWPEYLDDMSYLAEPGTVWNPYDWHKAHDVRTRYINVRDHERATWRPPACDCPTVVLWLYGGSTTFGMGQRDEHTIASELSKEAYRHGIRLVVHNRGVPGDTHWEASRRFAWDVTQGPKPDLVAFYDGANDVGAANLRNSEGDAWDDQPVSLPLEGFRQTFGRSLLQQLFEVRKHPDGAAPLPDPPPSYEGPEAVGGRAARDYERSRETTEAVADAQGIPATYFWQPVRSTRPFVAGENLDGPDTFDRDLYEAARAGLDRDVVDLSDVFDRRHDPLFYDSVHHNERGAKIVAAAMYEHLRPQVERAAEGPR